LQANFVIAIVYQSDVEVHIVFLLAFQGRLFQVFVGFQVVKKFRNFLIFEKLELKFSAFLSAFFCFFIVNVCLELTPRPLHHLAEDAEYSLRLWHFLEDADWAVEVDVVVYSGKDPKHRVAKESPFYLYLDSKGSLRESLQSLDDLRSDQQTPRRASQLRNRPFVY
jgi:hypothetical protein